MAKKQKPAQPVSRPTRNDVRPPKPQVRNPPLSRRPIRQPGR